MDNKELLISQPPIVCYLHHAYPLTAAMAHKDFYSWFFSNYIQLEYCLDDNTLNFFTCVICGNSIYIPIMDYKVLDLEFLSMSTINIIDFVISSIDMGYYVTTYLDEFFVPERKTFKKWHNRHEVMIFGYNSNEKLLKIVGYNDRSLYSQSNISFSEFEDSYINSISKQDDVILFKAKDNMSYQPSFEFDIKNVKYLLEDYVLSRDTFDRLRMISNPKSGFVYGIQVYEKVIKYFQSVIMDNVGECDIRTPHLLWEHKKTMVSRIEYLIENRYLDNSSEILTTYIELQNTALQIKNRILKYYKIKNKKLIETSIDSLEQMYNAEKIAIEDLVNKL